MLALMLLGGLVEGFSLALLVPLLALLSGGNGGAFHLLAHRLFDLLGARTPFTRLTAVIAVFATAMTLRAWVLMMRDRASGRLQLRYVEKRRLSLLRTVADAEWSRIAGLRHARVTSAISVEVARMASAAQATSRIAVAGLMLAVQLGLTIAISWVIGLIALTLVIVSACVAGTRLRVADDYGEKLGRRSMALLNTAGQLLGGLKRAAAENRQHDFVQDFAVTGALMVEEQLGYQARLTFFHFKIAVFTAAAGSLMLLTGAWLETDLASLLAALVILSRMTAGAVGIQRDVEVLCSALPAHRTLNEIEVELQTDVSSRPRATLTAPTGPITLEDVTYLHDEIGGVRNITLSIAPGEIVGIRGSSGAGKTTLIDLIAGLIHPRSGTVRIGTELLRDDAARAWRERIAYVAQDAYLTNDTIRRNLGARPLQPDEAEMWDALRLAGVADTVRAMPGGLDTSLSERGSRLSGGERQRIAIARAVLRRPSLLILDEATNAIDLDMERHVMTRLAVLDPTMTMLVVAHRKEALRYCTRILSIDCGLLIGDRPATPRTTGQA